MNPYREWKMTEGQGPEDAGADLDSNLDGSPEELTSVPQGFSVLGSTRKSPPGYRYTGATVVSTTADSEWQSVQTELPQPGRVTCVAVDDRVYALWDSGEVWAYDPERSGASAWIRKTDMPGQRRYAFGVGVLGKKIYVVGGFDGKGSKTNRVEEYDVEEDNWSRRAALPTPRSHLAVGALGGRLYAVGGLQTNLWGIFKNWITGVNEEYHPVSDTWFRRRKMPTARYAPGVGVVNGRMSVLGGEIRRVFGLFGKAKCDRNERYSPADDTWIQDSPMPTAKSHFGLAVINRRIFVSGGLGRSGRTAGTEAYDPISRVWFEEALMDLARSSHGVCVFDGAILALGGETPHGQTDSAEAYRVQTIFHVHRKISSERAQESTVGMSATESLSPGSRMFSRHEDRPHSPTLSSKGVNWGSVMIVCGLIGMMVGTGAIWKWGPDVDWSSALDRVKPDRVRTSVQVASTVVETQAVWAVISNAEGGNLYPDPSREGAPVARLTKGTMWRVTARSRDDDWVLVEWREKSAVRPGWISVTSVELPDGAIGALPVK